jgi:hypothetical protein
MDEQLYSGNIITASKLTKKGLNSGAPLCKIMGKKSINPGSAIPPPDFSALFNFKR